MEARRTETGELLFRDTLGSPIAAVIAADYRATGVTELVVCSVSGEVKGYLPAPKEAGTCWNFIF